MSSSLDSVRALDPASCQRARTARDPRFDGEFFVAVTSTGIYCRPVCPARLPAEHNVRYYRAAAQAAEAGFRPCLRCRPETAPGSPAWCGSATTVQRALRLIRDGALDGGGSVGALATRLGVGSRYLLKLFRRELGVPPSAIAAHQRLLLARQLLVETRLPMTEVAFAAGYGSLRRFNSAVRDSFGCSPVGMRRAGPRDAHPGLQLRLRYRAPYDWGAVLAFLERHAIDGLEHIHSGEYRRKIDGGGELRVRDASANDALLVDFELPAPRPLQPLVARLRRMMDLDANPLAVGSVLGADPVLAPLLARMPGVRCPGHFSAGEAAVRAIVGQQISTRAAQGICAGLCARCGAGFPSPAALAELPDAAFPMPGRRRQALRDLAGAFAAEGENACRPEALQTLRGVGPWTTAMVALRGWGEPDAFPAADLGLLQAWEKLGQQRGSLAARAAHWTPFRGYAATLLWRLL